MSDELSDRYFGIIMNMVRTECDAKTPHCEFCERPMTTIEHEFCDICDECREENDEYK